MAMYKATQTKPNVRALSPEHRNDLDQMLARGFTIYHMAKVINRSEQMVRNYIKKLPTIPNDIDEFWDEKYVIPYVNPKDAPPAAVGRPRTKGKDIPEYRFTKEGRDEIMQQFDRFGDMTPEYAHENYLGRYPVHDIARVRQEFLKKQQMLKELDDEWDAVERMVAEKKASTQT